MGSHVARVTPRRPPARRPRATPSHPGATLIPGMSGADNRRVSPDVPPGGPARTYLDAISSEPLHPAAREAWLAAAEQGYADPLRLHSPARSARLVLDNARAVVAHCLAVRPDEVSFTSSGTRATHLGVLGLLQARRRISGLLVHSAVEHSAVFGAARWWEASAQGSSATVGVDATGRVDPDRVAEACAQPVGVVAVQLANPEVGTVQPVAEVAGACGDVPLFVDACAGAGLLDLPPGWDAAAFSAHKWGGPAGVGVLVVRKGARWRAPFPTDDRVDHRVEGFETVPAALAAAAALQARQAERADLLARYERLSDRLRAGLRTLEDVDVHGHPEHRLPHVVSFSCLYLDGEALVTELDKLGFSVASGSACTASALEPSHVLVAMGALTQGNVRVSFTPATTPAEVDRLVAALPGVLSELRGRLA